MKENTNIIKSLLVTFAVALLIGFPVSASNVDTNFHNYLEAYYSKRYSIEDVTMGGNTYKDSLCFNNL